jgi:glycosyltransferase involved in cell wall biosynthesis
VSVVIPAFNRAHLIEAAIGSALNQSRAPTEIVVVDDGSSDGTSDIVEKIAKDDPRIRCFRQPVNAGPSAARNRGVREAVGDLIAFLDSDDTWQPNYLDQTTRFLECHPELSLVFTDMKAVSPEGDVINPSMVWESYKVRTLVRPAGDQPDWYLFEVPERQAVLNRYFLGIQASVVRRKVALAHPFDEQLRIGEDVDYLIRLGLAGCRFGFINRIGCHMLIHDSNCMSNKNASSLLPALESWAYVWSRVQRTQTLTRAERAKVASNAARNFFSIGYHHQESGSLKQTLWAYWRSFRAVPSLHPIVAGFKAIVKRVFRFVTRTS